jgi:hypothetical protein
MCPASCHHYRFNVHLSFRLESVRAKAANCLNYNHSDFNYLMVLWKCNEDACPFKDWRFVDDSPNGMLRDNWGLVNSNWNSAGVESMQAKRNEMFGEKEEETVEEVKVKKPRKKVPAINEKKVARKPAKEKKR